MRNGKPIVVQNKKYVQFEKYCLNIIKAPDEPIEEPVNVKCIYYVQDRRVRDLVNLQNATLDILVKAKVLKDDRWTIVQSMDGSRVYVDRDFPRTEITITRL